MPKQENLIEIGRNKKGQFVAGFIPWNKGKKCSQISAGQKGREPWNKGLKDWAKGTMAGFQKGNTLGRLTKGTKMTLAQRKRISEAHIGINTGEKNPNWTGGLPKCVDCGKQLSKYDAKRCKKCYFKSDNLRMAGVKSTIKQQNSKGPTSIEKKVYDELKARGILFEKQKLINGRFLVDAYIPSLNLVVEADGDYWHSLPKTVKRDKTKNAYLKTCGYNMLRLTETEINDGSFERKLPNA